ncbi:hypothetical protein [Nitrosomonas sp. PY1]|uniref:hypothetical protein n=1 Tax=Nitrosomonas sp. PY1 TaxID=1803906 RepID=UPI001FC84527|nr:hypothetical protein [Nitrosomonas sp. PY1]
MKQIILSTYTFLLLGNIHFASADIDSDSEILLNWAENNYSQYFSNHQVTQKIDPWIFRFYPDTGIYAGVNRNDNNVYVLGGPWADSPTLIDTLPNLMVLANSGNNSIPSCDTATAPAGLVYTQSGNVINVTTNGKCISLPTNNNLCQVPQQAAATGISVLTNYEVLSSEFKGFKIDIPGIPNPFESYANNFSKSKHCTINIPAEGANLTINSDVCYDMTAQFGDQYENIPGITITPPITLATKSTAINQSVPDCFATDAESIYDAFAKELWIKKDGAFVKQ